MAEDTDFAALYRTLGIAPACTPGQFRQAYRRAVARLHPDQRGAAGDLAELQELNRLYRAATEFQRTHGRLPGAPPTPADAPSAPVFAPAAAARSQAAPEEAPAEDEAGIDRMSRYFILLALLAIAALALHALETGGGRTGPAAAAQQAVGADSRATPDENIVLGMEKAQVKAIQGAPLGMYKTRWDYGPSWIDFECGGVVTGWHSSPLRPLRVATPHPAARDQDAFDAARPPGCP